MYFVVIRYSCELNTLKPVKYVPCWMTSAQLFFFLPCLLPLLPPFPLLALAVFKDRNFSGVFCITITEKENRECSMEGTNTNFPVHYWFSWAAEGSCCGLCMESGGWEEGGKDKADLGTAVPCKFFPIPMSFCSVESWSGFRLFMFTENWKLRSLTFLKSILSLIFQRFKQKILT